MVVMERFRADPVGKPVVRLGRSAQGFWLGAHAELEVGVCKIRKRFGSGGPRSKKSDPLGRTCFVVPEREGDEGDFWQSRMTGVQWQQVAVFRAEKQERGVHFAGDEGPRRPTRSGACVHSSSCHRAGHPVFPA